MPALRQRSEASGRVQAGRQAAQPPTASASLKPEPLLGKLKDARILLGGKLYTRTTNVEPNSHVLSRFH